jgi:Gametolysin peptidase M11
MKFSFLPCFLLATVVSEAIGVSHSLRYKGGDSKGAVEAELDFLPNSPRSLQAHYSTKSLGTRTFFFVRVSARDATPHPFSLQEWIDMHFRTDTTSFKSVIEGCSFWKLKVVNVGGMDVMLDGSVHDYDRPSHYLDAARAKVEIALDAPVTSLADHVVYCQPRNASWWTAIGPQDSNRINMHATTCTSLSVLVHEFGHNLDLLHSGQDDNRYGDETGMMGPSYGASDGPKKCFNGYKHYQLRWFEDRQLDLYNFSRPQIIKLATFVDYHKTTPAQYVVINLSDMFYIQYNRAKGVNEGTNEMQDLVTVTEDSPGYSLLRQGLNVNESFSWVQEEKTVFVSVCRRIDAATLSQPDVMEIAVGFDQSWCDTM